MVNYSILIYMSFSLTEVPQLCCCFISAGSLLNTGAAKIYWQSSPRT